MCIRDRHSPHSGSARPEARPRSTKAYTEWETLSRPRQRKAANVQCPKTTSSARALARRRRSSAPTA
eukprot:6653538-Pyramimonas_sp.AAC.1